MKNALLILILVYSGSLLAQFGVPQKDTCYLRKDKDGKTITSPRFAEWECGKLMGVIDCGEELTYDEEADIVYLKPKDNTNLTSAGKPFTGTCEMCHMNGRLQRRVTFLNGKEDGADTTKYSSGCMQVIRNFMQGEEHGVWTYYYDSTQLLAWEENYYLGEKHGKQIYFEQTRDEKGNLKLDTTLWENYKNGILDGVKRSYFPGSKIKKEISYKAGIFDGPFKIYNDSGVVIEELNYVEGKKDGEAKYYYDDGALLMTENWTNGVKNGEFKVFYYQGNIQVSENYRKGIKEGWFEEFYPDSKPKRRALYKKDVLIEEHKYDEHGRETYSFGAPTGDQKEDDEAPDSSKYSKKKKRKEK